MKKASIIAKLGAAAMAAVMACSSIAASAATVPNATIDTTRKTSLELYKYDFTTAHEDGKLNTDSYVSTGLPDDAVETALADYAIQGVVFTYTKVADVTTYSALEADGYKDMVLYAMPDNAKTAQFLAALGLSAADAYRTDGGNLYFTSDVLIDGLSGQLTTIESQTKNALEKFVKDNGGTDMPETDANGHSGKTGMEQGLYILVETYVPENVKDTTSPFLVSLPMTTIDADNWNYDVTVYPKNETGMPTLEKTLREDKVDTGKHNGTIDDITDGYAHTGTGSDGDIVDYQIISTLPTITSNATALTTYTFVDTLSKGIEYNKKDVQIEWFTDKACTDKIATWTEADNKFTVTYGTAANNATTMKIEMTDKGLEDDEYIITEIATDDGYTLLKDSITVVITSAESGVICDVCGKSGITATATVNGDAVGMIEDNGSVSAIVPMSVINTLGFDLPQTGENGTWLFAVGGVLIVSLSAAFIFFILAKKRKTDEQ